MYAFSRAIPTTSPSVAFSPDGKIVTSGSLDTTAKLWSSGSGKLLTTLLAFDDNNWIIFTPEGQYNSSDQGALYVTWRLDGKVYDFDQFFERYFRPDVISQSLQPYITSMPKQRPKALPATSITNGFALPPEVRIISPRPDQSFTTPDVEVAIETKDIGGGAQDIRLYHNGKLVNPGTRALKVAARVTPSATYQITLTEGENVLRAVAYSKDRTESRPAEVVVKLAAAEKEAALQIIVVGINNYKNPALNLNYAVPDADGIAQYFSGKESRLFREVNVLKVYNEQGTRANILKTFATLQAKAEPQDVVLIYFAGHGDSRGEQWYFIPHEIVYPERDQEVTGKAISSAMISEELSKIRSQKVLLLLDACRSGSAVTAFRGYEDRKSLAQLARSAGIHIVAASTGTQLAAEVAELGHGVFTYTLLKGLNGEAIIGATRKDVTVRSLLVYIEDQLPELSKKYKAEAQYPVSSSKGMDFPLALLP